MEIKLEKFEDITDRLMTLHYYFLFFLVGLIIAEYLIKREIKQKRDQQLNKIFFGSEQKEEDKHGHS